MSTADYIDLEKARRDKAKAGRSKKAPQSDPNDDRPVIRLVAGELERPVNAAEMALIGADVGLYQRAGTIVCTGTIPMLTAHKKEIPTVGIFEVGEHRLLELMMSAARFEKYDARAEGFVPTNCPMTIPKTLRERKGHLTLPTLTGILNAPSLRPDGTVLASPGYDEATGLLLDFAGARFPAIPDKPSQDEANRALKALEQLLSGFPFVSLSDKSVALAGLLTAVVRKSLPTAPAFAFSAPTAGSGKSTLVDLMSVLATGREAGVIAPGKNDEETEKRLASLLLTSSPIAIDNAESGIGGELLCQVLTQRSVRMRVLGKSDTPEMPTNVMVTITGNNLQLVGDMTRRALLCTLDPKQERPELREFAFDPVERAKEQRGALVAAALTVLRGYQVAGCPQQTARLGSFGDWSDTVRSALLWLGAPDPVDTIEKARTADPKLERLQSVLVQWNKVIGPERVSANEAAQRASQRHAGSAFDQGKPAAFVAPEFREALMSVAAGHGFVDTVKLGIWLGKNKDRVVQGMKLEDTGLVEGIKRWAVTRESTNVATHF